jgi:hypothetical protein
MRWNASRGTSTGEDPAVSNSSPPPDPRRSIADVLCLVGRIRRIAYGLTLEPEDRMRRIRDEFLSYDQPEVDAH